MATTPVNPNETDVPPQPTTVPAVISTPFETVVLTGNKIISTDNIVII